VVQGQSVRREATATTVRRKLSELLNQVQYQRESIVVTRHDKVVAALVDYELYERIRQMRAVFQNLTDELAQTYQGFDSTEADVEIAEAVDVSRRRRHTAP
jgi:prevent-host-death family protein